MHFWRGIPGTEAGCIQSWKRILGATVPGIWRSGHLPQVNVRFSAGRQLALSTLSWH